MAVAVTGAKRGKNAECGHQRAAANVCDLPGRLHRRSIGVTGQAKKAAHRQVVHVVAGRVTAWAVLAVAADRAVDKPGVCFLQDVVADTQPV